MKKPELCPYKVNASGQCSHKACEVLRKHKRYCGYKKHYNCPLFIEWVKKARKFKIEGREAIISGMGDEDASS